MRISQSQWREIGEATGWIGSRGIRRLAKIRSEQEKYEKTPVYKGDVANIKQLVAVLPHFIDQKRWEKVMQLAHVILNKAYEQVPDEDKQDVVAELGLG